MKKFATAAVTLSVAAALTLAGCASGDRTAAPATGSTAAPASGSASGAPVEGALPTFEAGATIGVSLPKKTSENWVLAEGLFNDGLTAAGYKPIVNFATNGVQEQQSQIAAQITNGAKVLVIGAVDGSQLGSQLQQAKDAGITVIAYDRNLMNTENVDMYVAYDNFKVGELQGTALLEGLAATQGDSPWNIELIAGSPDDANSKPFFEGAMSVLQPKIDDGTLVVKSGQVTQQQAATQDWLGANAQKRMDAILADNYADGSVLNGVLSPNDTLARAALASIDAAGMDNKPVITGQDSEVESIPLIADGTQYSTINKDTKNLVTKVIEIINQIQKGEPIEYNNTTDYDNGVKVVPAYLLDPVIVTKDNVCTAYAPDTAAGEKAAKTDLCKK